MAKKIAFLITGHGVDGREPESIVSAFWDEQKRDAALAKDKNKNFHDSEDRIVDYEKVLKDTLKKLNGLELLLLKDLMTNEGWMTVQKILNIS